jgi:LPS O-antigen subunit length determinant protein (WzzB/FepE family)
LKLEKQVTHYINSAPKFVRPKDLRVTLSCWKKEVRKELKTEWAMEAEKLKKELAEQMKQLREDFKKEIDELREDLEGRTSGYISEDGRRVSVGGKAPRVGPPVFITSPTRDPVQVH